MAAGGSLLTLVPLGLTGQSSAGVAAYNAMLAELARRDAGGVDR